MFDKLFKESGLSHMRFHDPRHSATTILLAMGVNAKVIQQLLGHSDITITAGLYSHLLPSMQDEATDLSNDAFGNDKEDEDQAIDLPAMGRCIVVCTGGIDKRCKGRGHMKYLIKMRSLLLVK